MKLQSYIAPLDVDVVLEYILQILKLFAWTLVLPFVASLFFGEYLYSLIFGSLSIGLFLIGIAAGKEKEYRMTLNLKDALVVTALSYLAVSLIGGICFLPEKSYIDGVFETMSGLTTTGLTMVDEQLMPLSLLFFRSYLQWLGGLGIIIISLAVLFMPGGIAFRLYQSEFGEENIAGSVISTARTVVKIYVVLTAVGFGAFLLAGMGWFDGLIHIFSAISTGGFSVYNDSIGHYHSSKINIVVTLFMFLGAVSFPIYYMSLKNGIKEFFRDIQVKTLFVIIAIASLFFIITLNGFRSGVTSAIFQGATPITGTGFTTLDVSSYSSLQKFFTSLLMCIGGGTGSTTGGIKILRLIFLFGLISWAIWKRSLPEEANIPFKVAGLRISDKEIRIVGAFIVSYFGILILSCFAIMGIEGFSFVDSLFEVSSAGGTVGLSVGITHSGLSVVSKIILIFDMWAGRLEVIPVLVALSPLTWYRRRSSLRKNT